VKTQYLKLLYLRIEVPWQIDDRCAAKCSGNATLVDAFKSLSESIAYCGASRQSGESALTQPPWP
jgi:hypothetical protein